MDLTKIARESSLLTKPEEGGAPPPPVGLPIDGGLSLLLISGVAYGIYALKRKKE